MISDNSYFGNHSVRDLPAMDLAMTASQIKRYGTDSSNSVFIPYLQLPIPNYSEEIPIPGLEGRKISMAKGNPISCEAAKELLEKEGLLNRIDSLDYNGLSTVCDYINYAEGHPELTAAAAFRSFEPDASRMWEKVKGSTCSGKCNIFVEILSREMNLISHAVLEKSFTTAAPNHAVVIVPCNDGILFVELLAPQSIVAIKANEVSSLEIELETPPGRNGEVKKEKLNTSFKIIRTEEDFRVQNLVVVKSNTFSNETGVRENTQSQFLLRGTLSPESPVRKRYILSMPMNPVVTKAKSNGEEIVIKVNFDETEVTLQRQSKPFRKVKIPFHVFNGKTKELDLKKESDGQKRQALVNDVQAFVGEGKTLEDFWEEFQAPQEIKEQVFMLVRPKSLQTMQELFREVGRDKKQLNPP